MRVHLKSGIVVAGIAATAFTLSACSSEADPETSDTPEAEATSSVAAASGDAVDLSGVCPADIKIQTDWNPEMEHGHLYAMLGDEYEVDANNKSVTGPLIASGEDTGVDITILSGGPAVGYAQPNAQALLRPVDLHGIRGHRRGDRALDRPPHGVGVPAAREGPADDHVGPGYLP
ncbi:hypothetical protein [Demequina litorisediminis]|uniref:Uncharacterized protein n=1 Tax=Demequina litorisediminis TaxID=1849022 RepID=A0ABQ6I861_9MICO|nr:hypothetical protein [Demequina litorisediminis]GMA34017.1 hypothetical protein GCM10025876_02210 [Demequina litorisediminis]